MRIATVEQQPMVVSDLFTLAARPEQLPWQPLLPGVDIYPFYQELDTSPRVALLRYQPGATVPHHDH